MSESQRTCDRTLEPLDAALAQLYRHWSRTQRLCGWVMLDEAVMTEFRKWLEQEEWRWMDDLNDNREDLRVIRAVWEEATGN